MTNSTIRIINNNYSHVSNVTMGKTISKARLLENSPIRPSATSLWWGITYPLLNARVEDRQLAKEVFDELMRQLTPAMDAMPLAVASEQDYSNATYPQPPYHSMEWYYDYVVYVAYYHNQIV